MQEGADEQLGEQTTQVQLRALCSYGRLGPWGDHDQVAPEGQGIQAREDHRSNRLKAREEG